MRTLAERRQVNKWLARAGPWRPPNPAAYAYLLGLYLGDRCLNPKGQQLMISLDAGYPGIVELAELAIRRTMPATRTRRYMPKDSVVRVLAATVAWREAFPQHGRGRKHERKIELVEWQREITGAFPREFLRGLIHSDGCRTMNRFKTKLPSGRVATYEYPATSSPT